MIRINLADKQAAMKQRMHDENNYIKDIRLYYESIKLNNWNEATSTLGTRAIFYIYWGKCGRVLYVGYSTKGKLKILIIDKKDFTGLKFSHVEVFFARGYDEDSTQLDAMNQCQKIYKKFRPQFNSSKFEVDDLWLIKQ